MSHQSVDSSTMVLTFILLFGVALTAIYWFLTKNYNYWKNENVPFVPDPIPGFGNLLAMVTTRDSIYSFTNRAYTSTKASVIGFYFMRTPAVIVRDPELVKNIVATNFPSFRGNLVRLNEKQDSILAKHPSFTQDPNLWKDRRIHVSNNLSGKKLRHLFVIAEDVSLKMQKFLDRKIDENEGFYECELKKHFTRYTGEVVANAALGVEGQCFEDNPDRLSFVRIAADLFTPTFINGIKQRLIFFMPELSKFLRLRFLVESAEAYFRENLEAIVKQRRQSNTAPNDFLQFCLDSNSGNDMEALIADLMIFYGDVYETSSTVLAHLFYHLSLHKEIQDKLRQHIISKLDGKPISYESLKEMNYLDEVLNESMRLTPPISALLKVCNEEITLTGSDGIKCHLKPGYPVFIPTFNLHQDETYWPNPERFDPERFSPENQVNITKYTFMPFGEGPRICIGMRLAVMLIKTSVTKILTEYSIETSSKTKYPLEIDPFARVTQYKGGVWARFKHLKKINL